MPLFGETRATTPLPVRKRFIRAWPGEALPQTDHHESFPLMGKLSGIEKNRWRKNEQRAPGNGYALLQSTADAARCSGLIVATTGAGIKSEGELT